jgi:hypothetical protein
MGRVVTPSRVLGAVLIVLGTALCFWAVSGGPGGDAGGPAVGVSLAAVLAPVALGVVALGAGVVALSDGYTRGPAAVLAGVLAVGAVYGTVELRLLLWLPATAFAVLAVGVVGSAVVVSYRVTPDGG